MTLIDQLNNDRRDGQKNVLIYGVPDGGKNELGNIVNKICTKYNPNFRPENVTYFRFYNKGKNSANYV